ncbi:TetR/AcrR family transcriptional regulator [Granulicella sp. dw_53]|uniref:TetR/AcrR family transcriptional regulator n=1 Tax=Granulicella sp. dw_53 TaxID=2719792 RepID=UPI00210224A8|nr:TetR/AcrR family transcriptional regulator [Granulicella sp. dw_53]
MPSHPRVLLEPRKSPVQARSTASVDAILEATIQVLLRAGKEQMTTTMVAARAGVSVGTLYQYFPNKSALLKAVLKRHLGEVTDAIEVVCKEHKGETPRQMVTALITAFLQAKMRDAKSSVVLYSVSSDVDGAKIVQETRGRSDRAIVEMFESASEPFTVDPQTVVSVIQGAMVGVSRRILESDSPEKQRDILCRELILMCCAYLDARSMPALIQEADVLGGADEKVPEVILGVARKSTAKRLEGATHS